MMLHFSLAIASWVWKQIPNKPNACMISGWWLETHSQIESFPHQCRVNMKITHFET